MALMFDNEATRQRPCGPHFTKRRGNVHAGCAGLRVLSVATGGNDSTTQPQVATKGVRWVGEGMRRGGENDSTTQPGCQEGREVGRRRHKEGRGERFNAATNSAPSWIVAGRKWFPPRRTTVLVEAESAAC